MRRASGRRAMSLHYFGNGTDGAVMYSSGNSRWEDGAGNALANGALFAGVGTTTLTIKRAAQFTNVTVPSGATLQLGTADSYGLVELRVSGTLTVDGTITSGFGGIVATGGLTNIAPIGGATKSTAGAGNGCGSVYGGIRFGSPGQGGTGGGDGTNAGGASQTIIANATIPTLASPWIVQGATTVAGSTGVGTDATAPAAALVSALPSTWDSTWLQWPGAFGIGGGSGALKVIGGSNVGGAGGAGGRGRLPVRIAAYTISISATGLIHADGEAGTAGSPGVATNASGDISGGGGGGGGGAGAPVSIRYWSLTNNGTVRSNGGSGAAGGAGYQYNASARASSNGGAGSAGTNGLVYSERVPL